ncbi:MAG: bifunctional UDP-N-acetylglucosamine diphosphorylase/glucosamine-1-phosphate N-acetyltransferase GlmU, partial [Acidimicrobiia bacterium]|nr:bifunctional UDP-N-acetylglucosamine diphosphorylase/glucosamine-1-phosphate N-acetyltransferase GlmU [Acidimicrobiia bacterium]
AETATKNRIRRLMGLAAVVLAAGQGTRMKSDKPKVLHRAAGRTLLDWALAAVQVVDPDRVVVVVGHGAGEVAAHVPEKIESVIQSPQLGTGHATAIALNRLGAMASEDLVLITYGDMPLVTGDLLRQVLGASPGVGGVMVSTHLEDPSGYGRVLRNEDGSLARVVEDRDATPAQRQVSEVNAGLYVFRGDLLGSALSQLAPDNAQGEYYLPDVVPLLLQQGQRVEVVVAPAETVLGVNSHDQLAEAEAILRRRINRHWQQEGVWMQDPDRVYIDAAVELAPGVRLFPGVHLQGSCRVESGAVIGPETFISDSEVGQDARIWYSVVRAARVGAGAEVGPYASLRQGTVLKAAAKAGTFVEMKNTTLGEGAKVPHLSYMGDATIGARANVGAGSITCNYDGFDKHHTTIGEEAFIGSDTMLVAPVTIGDRAVTGAGSVITHDVAEGALAVERSVQKDVPGYAARREQRHHTAETED